MIPLTTLYDEYPPSPLCLPYVCTSLCTPVCFFVPFQVYVLIQNNSQNWLEVGQLLSVVSSMIVTGQQQFEKMASNDGAWEKIQPETGKDQYSQEIFCGAVL